MHDEETIWWEVMEDFVLICSSHNGFYSSSAKFTFSFKIQLPSNITCKLYLLSTKTNLWAEQKLFPSPHFHWRTFLYFLAWHHRIFFVGLILKDLKWISFFILLWKCLHPTTLHTTVVVRIPNLKLSMSLSTEMNLTALNLNSNWQILRFSQIITKNIERF